MGKKKGSSSPLSRIAFKAFCDQLNQAVRSQNASASFACGGTIPIKGTEAAKLTSGTEKATKGKPGSASSPVNIFWDCKDGSRGGKLTLPLDGSKDDSNAKLCGFVADCEPAGFGRGQEAVMDPTYRKAGKLDTDHFMTSFHPADFGIIGNVEQVLCTNWSCRRIRLELYKLNVYSGPSGLFQSHVDTPRSKCQIGSLVVCLPSPFKGGNLIVRHEGREIDFDWEQRSADTIQWAAFYSDCEHEIKTITEGERITVTYNLYVTDEPMNTLPPSGPIFDPKTLPLYQDFKNVLQIPGFLKTGGTLGSFCTHAYPHTADDAYTLLPRGLKGADLVLYSVLKAFGIKVKVLPVIIQKDFSPNNSDSDDEYYEYARLDGKVYIGSYLTPRFSANNFEDDPLSKVLDEYWPEQTFEKPITWITHPSPCTSQEAMSYLAYGNEPSVHEVYSYAAIVAIIPPWTERQEIVQQARNN
ncbi:uncharacterized protein N7496_003779 [Penicillium cataractarum]|uniref:Fe2OG dioxygenase domain-containing protein n=1 Tax=Penicillium cataractarum TaxID=2100454 RepID=A0A9W9SMV4_9EURO|nr:uncharacterized protein N7496_003779 [Penicillium cataractarum]KAJ5381351.1 hypothetical protein N7496_003779 [Penicillium cataractarum]